MRTLLPAHVEAQLDFGRTTFAQYAAADAPEAVVIPGTSKPSNSRVTI